MTSENEKEKSDDEFHDAISDDEKVENVDELADCTDKLRIEDENRLTPEELEERKASSLVLKEEGNIFYKDSNYEDAILKYSEALALCPLKFETERSTILSNRAACFKADGKNEESLKDTNEALKLNPKYLKCLIRRGDLLFDSEDYEESYEDYKKILEIEPTNTIAIQKCRILPGLIEEKREKMKEEMFTQLKSLGNMVLGHFGLSTDNFKLNKDEKTGGYSVNFTK